jgi:hypothetical protein
MYVLALAFPFARVSAANAASSGVLVPSEIVFSVAATGEGAVSMGRL